MLLLLLLLPLVMLLLVFELTELAKLVYKLKWSLDESDAGVFCLRPELLLINGGLFAPFVWLALLLVDEADETADEEDEEDEDVG